MDLSLGWKPLSTKWVFKRKWKVGGSIDKYKERLVINGYKQIEGFDYFETYSLVMRINSIRMVLLVLLVLLIAALKNLEVHQMDVKKAFLNGDLDEEIYMEKLEGFSSPGQEMKVCKLVKSMYGLKQAPKQWHEKFDNVMMSHEIKINEYDKCVHVKNTEHGYVIVCLYIDDMLIVGSDDKMITSTKNLLNSRFDMKSLGLADAILRIKIKRTSDGLTLCQSHFVDNNLGKFDKDNSGIARTPVNVTLLPRIKQRVFLK